MNNFKSQMQKWISDHKKQIAFTGLIFGAFYLYWAMSIGGLISFIALYNIGFNFLNVKIGLNEWIARAIMIPFSAMLAYSVSMSLSLINNDRRIAGRIIFIVLLTAMSAALYFVTKDRFTGAENFDSMRGDYLKKYAETEGKVELFPGNMNYHPKTGVRLEAFTPEKATEFSRREAENLRKIEENSKELPPQKNLADSLFDNKTGDSLYNYYETEGQIDLFPKHITIHPSLGKKLELLTQNVLDNLRKRPKNTPEKIFQSNRVWKNTGYYVFKGDVLKILARDYTEVKISDEGIPKKISDGTSAVSKDAQYQYEFTFTAERDGRLFVWISNDSVKIFNLYARIEN